MFDKEASLTGFGDTLVDYSKMTNIPAREAIGLLNALFRIVTNDNFSRYLSAARKLKVAGEIDVVPSAFESLPDELAGADIAVNPRVIGVGIPQKLLNYMAVGMPIVSFAGTAKGIFANENGLLIPDGDINAFATAMDQLLDDYDLAARLGGSARDANNRPGLVDRR